MTGRQSAVVDTDHLSFLNNVCAYASLFVKTQNIANQNRAQNARCIYPIICGQRYLGRCARKPQFTNANSCSNQSAFVRHIGKIWCKLRRSSGACCSARTSCSASRTCRTSRTGRSAQSATNWFSFFVTIFAAFFAARRLMSRQKRHGVAVSFLFCHAIRKKNLTRSMLRNCVAQSTFSCHFLAFLTTIVGTHV